MAKTEEKEINQNYLDMSTSGSLSKVKIINLESVQYDNVKNIRPIYENCPANLAPMEIVPMIQF